MKYNVTKMKSTLTMFACNIMLNVINYIEDQCNTFCYNNNPY